MKRLTTDAPKNNLESALNLFYAKDGEAWVLRGGSGPNYVDVTLFDYIRSAILNVLGPSMSNLNNDELSEVLSESWLFDGNSTVEGLIATLYTAAWAFAELRERLKMYEDREQEERENPKPLTLDELMEMNEEPVWIKLFDRDEEFWVLRNEWVDARNPEPLILFHMRWYSHADYGKTWLAYRSKPKEEK